MENKLPELDEILGDFGKIGSNNRRRFHVETPKSLKICAPIKDMDMEGMEVKGNRVFKHVPDPVVLQPVAGGYLVVTKWGDEANDPILANPTDN